MALSQVAHRPSALKQQNKKHGTLGHKSKGQLKAPKGRESVKISTKKAKKELGREVRRLQSRQLRTLKRDEISAKKRSLGTEGNPPFLVSVIPLSPEINPRAVLEILCKCDTNCTLSTSSTGIKHISCQRFKQRFSFVVPPVDNLYAVLDCLKVSDTILLVWPPGEELPEAAELLLSSILAQGLPSPIHAVMSVEQFAQKKKVIVRQRLLKEIESRFPGPVKLHYMDKQQDALLMLRQIGAQKRRPVFYRDHRPHLIAESISYIGEDTTGVMKVAGYLRGQTISANDIVHIPGLGDFQLSQIDLVGDPNPLNRHRLDGDMIDDTPEVFEMADAENRETLVSTNEVDPMEGEQTWPTPEELLEADQEQKKPSRTRTKRIPKGMSEYQAAWIVDSDEEEEDDDVASDEDEVDEDQSKGMAPIDVNSQDGDCSDGEDGEEYETMTMTDVDEDDYDNNMCMASEMDALEKHRAAREDAKFPDEIDTPTNTTARMEFQKYRGLESFRTSVWDPLENLPVDYSKIFQFHRFFNTKRRIYKNQDGKFGALPGWYVVLHIANVPRYMYDNLRSGSQGPPIVFGLLPYEQKMSVMNLIIKSNQLGHIRSIKSKDRLVYHIGFRRFANSAIFSEHTSANKHKYARYFHPGQTVVATMYAPVTFPPASVLVFRERPDGAQELVATGSLLSMDPNRIICKRVVLSGHPLKVNKKSAVVRYMFFNRADVEWFKPVELRTKWGRRGNIREPLGTHGHMKCIFDGQLKSQDTILLNLYKRMFPKWTFDPFVKCPPPIYNIRSNQNLTANDNDEDSEQSGQNSSKNKKRRVQFLTSR